MRRPARHTRCILCLQHLLQPLWLCSCIGQHSQQRCQALAIPALQQLVQQLLSV